jgi:L-threonylcarbamoyladenylate synthase
MKTIPLRDESPGRQDLNALVRTLDDGGLVCLPCAGNYRILADLTNPEAVTRLLQSKRRTRKAPSLVFVSDLGMLTSVASAVDPLASKLAERMWPGRLTILFDAHPDLPPKVVKQLCKANGKLGVRVPDDDVARRVVADLGRPVLVSSANKERKAGAGSPAQVRKTFGNRVDLFLDAGDLRPAPSSTVVDLRDGQLVVTRPGAVSQEQIDAIQDRG